MDQGQTRKTGGISIKDGEVIEVGEINDKTPYVCQYIVCTGSNDDPTGMSGISHLAEHYLNLNFLSFLTLNIPRP